MQRKRVIVIALRGAAFLMTAAYLLVNPAYTQFVEHGDVPYMHSWALYHHNGRQWCALDIVRIEDDGARVRTSRLDLAGLQSWDEFPEHRRRVHRNKGYAEQELKRMCRDAKETYGNDVKVEVRVRCGDEMGWGPERVAQDICDKLGRKLRGKGEKTGRRKARGSRG